MHASTCPYLGDLSSFWYHLFFVYCSEDSLTPLVLDQKLDQPSFPFPKQNGIWVNKDTNTVLLDIWFSYFQNRGLFFFVSFFLTSFLFFANTFSKHLLIAYWVHEYWMPNELSCMTKISMKYGIFKSRDTNWLEITHDTKVGWLYYKMMKVQNNLLYSIILHHWQQIVLGFAVR